VLIKWKADISLEKNAWERISFPKPLISQSPKHPFLFSSNQIILNDDKILVHFSSSDQYFIKKNGQ
jgi:hypothetical protein